MVDSGPVYLKRRTSGDNVIKEVTEYHREVFIGVVGIFVFFFYVSY